MNILETTKLSNMFKNAAEQKYDIDQVIKSLTDSRTFAERSADASRNLEGLSGEVLKLTGVKRDLDKGIQKSKAFYDEVLGLEGIGFGREQLEQLKEHNPKSFQRKAS